eukprot:6203096-Pleurochrysis_carterae.AAC.1
MGKAASVEAQLDIEGLGEGSASDAMAADQGQLILNIMRASEAFAELFSAWREVWAEDTAEYRAKSAIRFAHAGHAHPNCQNPTHLLGSVA